MNHQSKTNSYTDFFYEAFRNILLVSVPLAIISAIILSSLHISATGSGNGTDSLTISISSACTLGSVVDIEHNTNTNVGTYTSDIGKTTIKTLCNDGNGYSVYATGYSNNEEGNNKLINSEYPQYSIDTGLATSGLTSAWAMKLNNIPDDPSPTPPTIETEYNNTYGIVPPYWTKVASRASGTTDMDEGSSFTTTYAVYASSNQHTGTYVGQVKYVLTHPSYQPYIYYMQEVDKWKNSLALEESVQAIDMRDGKSYWVTKLKDGNVWMTQNLDFDIDIAKTYTHNDTDLGWDPNNFDANATWQPNPSLSPIASLINAGGNNIRDWTSDYFRPRQLDAGDLYFYKSNRFNSLQSCINAEYLESECKHFHAGNYYNWSAAVAENNTTGYSANYYTMPNSICPAGWRLPKGLSKKDDTVFKSDFDNLLLQSEITVNSTTVANQAIGYLSNGYNLINNSPIYFVVAGDIDSTLQDLSNGLYWTNTTVNGNPQNFAYLMKYNSSYTYPSYSDGRNRGMPIRCIAR